MLAVFNTTQQAIPKTSRSQACQAPFLDKQEPAPGLEEWQHQTGTSLREVHMGQSESTATTCTGGRIRSVINIQFRRSRDQRGLPLGLALSWGGR